MFVLIVFAAALVLMPAAASAGRKLRLWDDPGGDPLKIHRAPVSVLGGTAVLVPVLVVERPSVAVSAAVAVALVAGLADDVRALPPLVQGIAQLGAGVALASAGDTLAALALVLVLACANGVNFLDGQDGLAAGLAAIAAVTLAALGGGGIGFALAAALCAFVLWNAAGNKLFLGNGGAYGVGVLLAALAVGVVADAGWRGLCAAALALAVFACELAHTVLRRVGSGAVTAGDRLHSYDVLAAELGSRTRSTLCFWGLGLLAAGLAGIAYVLPLPGAVALTVATFACAALVAYRPRHHLRARSYVG